MAVDTRYVTHDKWTSLVATEVTYPNGRQVANGYDPLYRRNAVNEVSGGASIAAWEFFGNRTATVALGNGITCSFMNDAQTHSAVQVGVPNPTWGDKTTDRLGYDGSGRMIAKRFLPSGSTTSLVGFTTAYDPSSNKLYERALDAESRSGLYPGYDSMDRLLEYQRGTLASGGGSVASPIALPGTDSRRTYDLDGLGNWKNTAYTPEGGSPTTEIRQHNKLNEITEFASTPVLYDHGNNAGNANPLIAQRGNGNIVNDGTRICAYDALNRLATVKSTASGTPQVAAYTYDALGRRVLKTVTNGGIAGTIANVTYRYLFDGQQIVEEFLDASGSYSTLRQFAWGQYIDELIQLKIPNTTTTPPLTAGTYYPLQDLLYRTTATTNSSGAIVEAYDYDAYGNTLMYSEPGTDGLWFTDDDAATLQPMCEYLFTGREYDPETEIYWYRARYYLQALGRFGNKDPGGYIEQENEYQFVVDNPVALVDPFGFQGEAATQPTAPSPATQATDPNELLHAIPPSTRPATRPAGPVQHSFTGSSFHVTYTGPGNPTFYQTVQITPCPCFEIPDAAYYQEMNEHAGANPFAGPIPDNLSGDPTNTQPYGYGNTHIRPNGGDIRNRSQMTDAPGFPPPYYPPGWCGTKSFVTTVVVNGVIIATINWSISIDAQGNITRSD